MDSPSLLSKNTLLLFWVYLQGWEDYDQLNDEQRDSIIENFVNNHAAMTQAQYIRNQIDGILNKYGAEITIDWNEGPEETTVWPVLKIEDEIIPL